MSGFAYKVGDTIEKIDIHHALDAECALVWVHLSTNDTRAQTWLTERAQLDSYIVDALTATETRPRCDPFRDGALINLRGRTSDDTPGTDLLASVRMWVVDGRVISVSRKALTAIPLVQEKVEKGLVKDPGDLIAAIAGGITEDLDPEVADLGDLLDDCEAEMDAEKVFELRRMVTKVRISAIAYRRFLSPQRAAIEKLAALPVDWLQDDDRLHLASAGDRAARMAEELESIRERAALTHEALTDLRAEQIDSRSLLISVAAMVFLPITFITGLYGMNVDGLPYQHAPWAFDAICAVCAAITAGVVIYFVQRHWFAGR